MGRIILPIQVSFLPLLSAFSRLVNYCLAGRNPESRLKRLLSGLRAITQVFTGWLKAERRGKKAIYRGGLFCQNNVSLTKLNGIE
jgi:hypothetical protein